MRFPTGSPPSSTSSSCAKINGKGPFNFILDTGAARRVHHPDAAEKLGVERDP